MKSHLVLLRRTLIDSGIRCCTSTTQDYKYILSRVEAEGLSYVTIALPQFEKDLQKGLARGKVDSSLFVGYTKKGCLPRFLGGFTSQIFNPSDGMLLDEPSIEAIHCVKQVTCLFSKVNLPCSDARVKAAMDKYIECEKQVRLNDSILDSFSRERFEKMSFTLFRDVFLFIDKLLYDTGSIPKHGPGATADKLKGNQKFDMCEWTQRLEEYFPARENLIPNERDFDHAVWDLLDPGAERPVRVITVPKTLKTPRIIAIEPACMQYTQQGILELLVERLERDRLLRPLIGFTDQTPNQRMARIGSSQGDLATLDLSEASDRVSNQHVKALLRFFPTLAGSVEACRSRKADVPGYGVVRLAKFASMGSALCFPMEAMVFLTIIFLGIEDELSRPLTRRDISRFSGRVRVYGDDIIVPVEFVPSVIAKLQAFGLVVNSDKSFWTGKFRESCGKEYYDGIDVSCVKLRQMLPTKRTDVPELIASVSLRNQFYLAGMWKSAGYLDDVIERLIPFPNVLDTSPALGRTSFMGYDTHKICPNLQRDLVWAAKEVSVLPKSNLDGYGALLKFFLKRGEEPYERNHLERAGRPDAVSIKLGLYPPY